MSSHPSLLEYLRHGSPPPGRLARRSLRPVLRAFALGYLTTTGPKLLACFRLVRRTDLSKEEKLRRVVASLKEGFGWNKIPAFCALLAFSATSLPRIFENLLAYHAKQGGKPLTKRNSSSLIFASVLITAWLTWPALNGWRPRIFGNAKNKDFKSLLGTDDGALLKQGSKNGCARPQSLGPKDLSGRTLDLTLAATARALDVMCCLMWDRYISRSSARLKPSKRMQSLIPDLATSGAFAFFSGIIMWAWFYSPERLSSSYRGWITSAAEVDMRLIEALRGARHGEWTYGKPSPSPPQLDDLAEALGLDRRLGDYTKVIPFPCILVHTRHGGDCCELHGLWRFWKGFKFAFAMYFPLQLLMQVRRGKKPDFQALQRMVKNSGRSAAFLGAFISIFYYSVCLVRTRIGPALFDYDTVKPMTWDGGACVGAGCFFCGWSVLLESARKRVELALFVIPKGMGVLLPRRYENKYRWREQAAFSLSLAILLSAARTKPEVVRGMFGKVLKSVLDG